MKHMNFYSITYDLIRVRDYTKTSRGIMQLCNNKWAKPTQSQWIVATNKIPGQIRDYLRNYLDHDDVLFIAKGTPSNLIVVPDGITSSSRSKFLSLITFTFNN